MKRLIEIIKELSNRSILVCSHISLTPQSFYYLGGYKIQRKEKNEKNKLIDETLLLEESGIEMLIVECIPEKLAKKIEVLHKKIALLKKINKKIGLIPTMSNLHNSHIQLILLEKKYTILHI